MRHLFGIVINALYVCVMESTKRIIQRALPLSQKYTLISTNYISLVDGYGCACDNCGKLIANMATVKGDDNKYYTIGLDCLETFLINNNILDGKSIEQFKIVKKSLPKVVSVREQIKTFLKANTFITGVKIENLFDSWITINYFQGSKQRWNDGFKYKTMDFELLLKSLSSIDKNIKFELI